jgi:adenylate cyclase
MMEFERRFIVPNGPNLDGFDPQIVMQGYFLNRDGYVIRVRRISTPQSDGEEYGSITVKGPRSVTGSRQEEERYFDDPSLAGELLRRCHRKLLKRRYALPDTWTVDVFDWDNEGLVIAEYETEQEATLTTIDLPPYVGREITGVLEFNNEWLAYWPWTRWNFENRELWVGTP